MGIYVAEIDETKQLKIPENTSKIRKYIAIVRHRFLGLSHDHKSSASAATTFQSQPKVSKALV